MKKALIVVSFGTSYPETRKKTIEAVENRMIERFPECDVFRAFTSNVVIKKIKEQEGVKIPTVNQLMLELKEKGYKEVFVQPLHVINGSEYSKALHQAKHFKNDFDVIEVGRPLMTEFEDYEEIVEWLRDLAQPLAEKEAVVLMGHGTQHSAFTAYACLDHMLSKDPVFICAVESYPGVETVVERLKEANIEKVYLHPFMLVAGDHATNDMASDEEDSWKSQLTNAGFEVEPILKGMGEYPKIQNMFLEHAKKVVEGEE
ncbi:MAG: sirohydrochlorin cobaltochelatase [Vagococcus sp.]|uniref:sirohydrochlorin cobaltochelatase n=1 Tax=Vagococcus sp. TaxID=1933889 RepID=UPI002FCC848C